MAELMRKKREEAEKKLEESKLNAGGPSSQDKEDRKARLLA